MTGCLHCGAPCDETGDAFCCIGCETVYHALQGGGLDAFYRVREIDHRPARKALTGDASGLSDPTVLARCARPIEGTPFHEIDLHLDGAHCAACVWLVEQLPAQLPGVASARLDLSRGRLRLRWDEDAVHLDTIGQWLARFGYVPRPAAEPGEGNVAERRLLVRMGVSWAIAGNVMLLAAALYAGLGVESDAGLAAAARWVSLALTAASVAYGGREFFARAIAALRGLVRRGTGAGLSGLGMDVPIALGIAVGFVHSSWATVTGTGEVWFDSIAVLIAALLTARWLQMRGQRVAREATQRLVSLLPQTARRIQASEAALVVTTSLVPGDTVRVLAGEVVPADGTILSGQSTVHRGILTGESVPEPVTPGAEVHAGVTNLTGPIDIRVRAAAAQTRVGRLMSLIEGQSERRAPVVQLADRLGGFFVFGVLLAASLTGIAWTLLDPSSAVEHVVALLVVSCPCALGMATPLGLAVAVGRGARRGIFIKHDDVLERAARATHVVLDKTGTLTRGELSVRQTWGTIDAAAGLVSMSTHPISRAIASALKGPRPLAVDVEEVAGCGLAAGEIRVGKPEWCGQPDPGGALATALGEALGLGLTPVAVSINGAWTGLIGLRDELRPDAHRLLDALFARDITPILLSGDHVDVVRHTASQLGIDTAHGGMTPEGKREFVTALKVSGNVVMMVGDGVNDASAIQEADIGIAVHGGADVSVVAADVFTTRPGLGPVVEVIAGAEEVMRTIRRNLALSLLYNVTAVSLAATGFVGPLLAAVAMPLSSLLVVGSSLAQRRWEHLGGARRRQRRATPTASPEARNADRRNHPLASGDRGHTRPNKGRR
jgi:P-type Cu2+ transporter